MQSLTGYYQTAADHQQVRQEVFADLESFGARICDEIDSLGRQAEESPPYLRYCGMVGGGGWGHGCGGGEESENKHFECHIIVFSSPDLTMGGVRG